MVTSSLVLPCQFVRASCLPVCFMNMYADAHDAMCACHCINACNKMRDCFHA